MPLFSLITTLILYIGFCLFPRYSKKYEFDKLKGAKYAHRGYHHDNICENSLEAYKEAIKYNYGFEFDVQRTKDDVLVVMHDESLKRACGVDKKISDCTYDEIKDLKLFNTESNIPLFTDVLALVNGQVPLIIEIKQFDNNTRTCELVANELDHYPGLFCVESFHPLAVRWFLENRKNYVRGQLSENYKDNIGFKPLMGYLLQNLLTNIITRPDFVAYKVEDRDKVWGFKLFKNLYKGKTVLWTIRDNETYNKCYKDYDLLIFENFIPEIKEEV